MSKKSTAALMLGLSLTLLSGCGTIMRNDGYHTTDTYRGFNQDKRVVGEPLFWLASLGILPIFSIVSMPIDIVIDTFMYPFDKIESNAKWERYRLAHIVPVYSVNLTGEKDFTYKLTNESKTTPLVNTTALKETVNSNTIPKVNIDDVIPDKYSYSDVYSLKIIKHTGSYLSRTNKPLSGGDIEVDKTTQSKNGQYLGGSIVIVFLPCDEIVIFGSKNPLFDPARLKQADLQNYYRELKQQSEQSQCPSPTPSTLVISG